MTEETRDLDWKDHVVSAIDPRHGLWQLLPSPLIAAVHFAICYLGTSVYCIRSDTGDLTDMRIALG